MILSQTLWSVNAKIVQTESRTSSLFECFAEVQPILYKDRHYLRNKYYSSHNNSKFENSTLPSATIQHSTFNIAEGLSSLRYAQTECDSSLIIESLQKCLNFQLERRMPIAFSMRCFIKFFDSVTSLNVSSNKLLSIGRSLDYCIYKGHNQTYSS